MPHLVARDSSGNYVHHSEPGAVLEQVSGVLVHVRSWNDTDRSGLGVEAADMWVPVEHVDDIINKSLSNKGRVGRVYVDSNANRVQSNHPEARFAGEDRAWDHCEVIGDGSHEDGPGGPNQLWHDDVPGGVTISRTHPMPSVLPEGVNR